VAGAALVVALAIIVISLYRQPLDLIVSLASLAVAALLGHRRHPPQSGRSGAPACGGFAS